MNRLLVTLATAALIAAPFSLTTAASAGSISGMPTCDVRDPVVWVNTKTGVYHMPGDAYYGKTKSGAYVCKSAADAKGLHMAHIAKGMKKPVEASGTFKDATPSPSMPKKKKHTSTGAMSAASPTP